MSSMKGRFTLDTPFPINTKLPSEPAYLNEIPFDLKDKILGLIDSPKHLLSMALVSKDWAALVIPNHIEYRILRVHPDREYLWDHLTLRADLAKNIRSVRLMKDHENEMYPTTLCPAPQNFHNIAPIKIAQAFQNLKELESLSWAACPSGSIGTLPNHVFSSLIQCHNLEVLRLGQISDQLESSEIESLWKLPNIKKLTLQGTIWAKCIRNVEDAFVAFLDNLPELKELTISYLPMSPIFTSCALPKLTKLHLWPEFNVTLPGQNILSADDVMRGFLESHPTIEDLRWYPIDQGLDLPQGFLPVLKRMLTTDRIAKKLLRDTSIIPEREIQLISQISLGPNTIKLLQEINSAHLQELHLWRFEDLDQIQLIAVLLPNIRTIDIPNLYRAGRDTVDDCINTLACFQYLEHFLDSSLWLAINMSSPHLVALIQQQVNKLAARCPNLQTLRHWKTENNKAIKIVLKRRPANVAWIYGDQVSWEERIDDDE